MNTETRPWIHGGSEPRRAGVNAFGFGGINAHAVLEEPDGVGVDHRPPWDGEVYILESDSPAGLREQAARLAAALEREPASLTDLAFTLARRLGRVERPQRLAIVATSLGDLREKLGQALEKLGKENCRRIKTASGIYYASEPLGRDAKVVLVFPARAPSTRTCSPTSACTSARSARSSTGSTGSTPGTRAAICSATGSSPPSVL